MARRRRQNAPWRPRPEVEALIPEISGNDINGLGEAKPRRPTPVMWHDSDRIAHGALQDWFRANGSGPMARAHRRENLAFKRTPLPQRAPERPGWSPEETTARLRAAALAREADFVGIARMRPEWIFEGYEVPQRWIVLIGVAMDYDQLSTAPSALSQAEVQKQYARGTRAAYRLAAWMRESGLDAEPHGGPEAGPVLLIPPAVEAGMGELGKHGSMIHRVFGSSFRLACVLTDTELVPDASEVFGADDFCLNCRICTEACPVDAIADTRQTVRGDEKWYVDFDLCFPYFIEHQGCGICIAQCPWSRTGLAPRLAEKMTRRRARAG